MIDRERDVDVGWLGCHLVHNVYCLRPTTWGVAGFLRHVHSCLQKVRKYSDVQQTCSEKNGLSREAMLFCVAVNLLTTVVR